MSREHLETNIIRILRILGIIFFVIIVAFPFYWMIVSSFKSLEEILLRPGNLWLDIRKINFCAYYEVLFEHGFARHISNSAYVSIITVALSVTLATVGGTPSPGSAFAARRLCLTASWLSTCSRPSSW
jgi:multiple sugar transport system permease protein